VDIRYAVLCSVDAVLHIFSQQTGFTFHVFWHIFIGLDGYTVSVLLTCILLNKLGLRPSVKWFVNAIPYCVLDKQDK